MFYIYTVDTVDLIVTGYCPAADLCTIKAELTLLASFIGGEVVSVEPSYAVVRFSSCTQADR